MRSKIALVVIVLLAFGIIVSLTGLLGKFIGKTGEQISLGLIAMILLGFLLYDKNRKD